MPELDVPLVSIASLGVSQVDGLDGDGRVHNVVCPANYVCTAVGLPVEQMMWNGGLSLADRQVVLVNDNAPLAFPAEDWLVVSEQGWTAVDAQHRVHVSSDTRRSEVLDLEFSGDPVAVVGYLWTIPASPEVVACVLDTHGQITCEGTGRWEGMAFDNGPYQRLEGHGLLACAQRLSDHVVECSNGIEVDWGPLVSLSVSPFVYRTAGLGYANPFEDDYEPPICAITIDDEVRCQGAYFAPEVLDALADL